MSDQTSGMSCSLFALKEKIWFPLFVKTSSHFANSCWLFVSTSKRFVNSSSHFVFSFTGYFVKSISHFTFSLSAVFCFTGETFWNHKSAFCRWAPRLFFDFGFGEIGVLGISLFERFCTSLWYTNSMLATPKNAGDFKGVNPIQERTYKMPFWNKEMEKSQKRKGILKNRVWEFRKNVFPAFAIGYLELLDYTSYFSGIFVRERTPP